MGSRNLQRFCPLPGERVPEVRGRVRGHLSLTAIEDGGIHCSPARCLRTLPGRMPNALLLEGPEGFARMVRRAARQATVSGRFKMTK